MREFVDLYDIPECQCPRVYWPICANDNITYVNHCILNCNLKKNGGMRRYGPCVHYRRRMMSFVEVVLPKTWEKASVNNTVEKVRPEDFVKVNLVVCDNCTGTEDHEGLKLNSTIDTTNINLDKGRINTYPS